MKIWQQRPIDGIGDEAYFVYSSRAINVVRATLIVRVGNATITANYFGFDSTGGDGQRVVPADVGERTDRAMVADVLRQLS